MKKMMMTLIALLTMSVAANAMSYEQARNEALFLTDKMAYELDLTDEQYEAAYEINLDYLMGVTSPDDVYGIYWERRNLDMSYILYSWQWEAFRAASYFFRPLYWSAGRWHFGIYARYTVRDYFYFGRPSFYVSYRGGHAWHVNGGRSYYYGRRDHFRPAINHRNDHFGMRQRYDRHNTGGYRSHLPLGRDNDRPRIDNRRNNDRQRFGNNDRPRIDNRQRMNDNRRSNSSTHITAGQNNRVNSDFGHSSVPRQNFNSGNSGNTPSVTPNRPSTTTTTPNRSFGNDRPSTTTTRPTTTMPNRPTTTTTRPTTTMPNRPTTTTTRPTTTTTRPTTTMPNRPTTTTTRPTTTAPTTSRHFGGSSSSSATRSSSAPSRSFGGSSSSSSTRSSSSSHSSGGSRSSGGHFGGRR